MQNDFEFRSRRSNVFSARGMVATSQPLAVQAGLEVLRFGGNAADGAIAAAAMLAVVEPISCGLGGDCFVLYFNAKSGAVTALNGSGRAAAGADPAALRARGYSRMPRFTGAAVTVPGAVQAWHDLQARHGTMPWIELLKPAIRAAEAGYPVTEWIEHGWNLSAPKLRRDADWKTPDVEPFSAQPSGHELLRQGRAPAAGEVVALPTLAATLRQVAEGGEDAFYRGDFARKCAAYVQARGGWLTAEDFAKHRSTWDEPLTCEYRGVTLFECPPNGQGLAATLACNLAAGLNFAQMTEADRTHHAIECMRLGFADAQRWVFDPVFAKSAMPLRELFAPGYSARRRAQIDPLRAAQGVQYGDPLAGSDTAYLSVVDGAGNACSLIQSNYMGVGTGLVVPGTGVTLQNRGAGFSLEPGHPNELAGGKRPYHTIIPALTTRGGTLHACFGVMGGYMQPQGHFQMLINMLDLGMWPQQALDMPRWQVSGPEFGLGVEGGSVLLEEGFSVALIAELARRGHRIQVLGGHDRVHFGGGQIITRDPASGVLCGGSDPRKDGCAGGL